jgi:hypothetical protein
MFEVLFLEATVDVTAQVGKAEGAVCEVGERGNLLANLMNGGEMGVKERRAGGTKKATLSTRFGTPCKEMGLMGTGKVGHLAGGVLEAMGGKKDGSGIGNHERTSGGEGWGTETEATKTGRELEQVLSVRREGCPGDFLEKLIGRSVNGISKRGGPKAWIERRDEGGVSVEISRKEVRGGQLGTFAKELGSGLEVRELLVEGEGLAAEV